ncbi:MAG TPA: hypothetical protein VG649_15935 [Candidatus Angelobacter sp.]|nr:hypothetical protein [Candidatus Angelobacter sp.]
MACILVLHSHPVATPGITATFSPAHPTVGVTKVSITGKASPGATLTDTSTFPDGKVRTFSFTANSAGEYTDGPFVLQQLGIYHDVLRDSVTGASIPISYSGIGDFTVAIDPVSQTIAGGDAANYTVTFTSISGFGGVVVPSALNWNKVSGAVALWSALDVKVPPNGSASATLTIQTLKSTPARTYEKIIFKGSSGAVTHAASSSASLTVGAPRKMITATFSPAHPTVGVTQVGITGMATAGESVTDVSTFPDGTVHQFSFNVNNAGAYIDGPFLLRQLGTYYDVLRDNATGASTALSYSGSGDFSVAVDASSQTITPGQATRYKVTFTSLDGFEGIVTPAALNVPKIPELTATWSVPAVTVPSKGSASATLTIQISPSTTPGTYGKITVQGKNGSVAHAATIGLTVK